MGRYSYVFETVGQLESTHPQAVADMLAHAASMYTVGLDRIARRVGDGSIYWAPRQASSQLTEAFPHHGHGSPSAAAMAIGTVDIFSALSQPFTAELPAAILEVVAAEPSGAVGLSYRRYVQTALLPGIRRVAAILRSHAATIEWPSVAWQKERFPGRGSADPPDGYASYWLGALAVAYTATSHDSMSRDLSRLTVRQNDGQATRAPGRRSWQRGTRASTPSCCPGSGRRSWGSCRPSRESATAAMLP